MSTTLQQRQPSILRQKRKFSQQLFERVCQRILDGDNTLPAIEQEGISKRQFYRHVSNDPRLAELFKDAQNRRDQIRNIQRIEEAERELHRRAVEGWEEPVFDIKGNLCGHKRKFSDACLIFLLKSLKPETFADRPQALVQNNLTIAAKSEAEILAEWRQRLGASQ